MHKQLPQLPRLLIPKSRAFPPVECCRGTSPSQEENSRPFRKADPLPIAATIAVATNGPMPGICLQLLTGWIGRSDLFDLFVHRHDLLLQVLPLAPQQADEITHARREVRITVLEDLGHRQPQLERSFGEDHATLEQEGSQLIDDGGSPCDQSIPYAVHGLEDQAGHLS